MNETKSFGELVVGSWFETSHVYLRRHNISVLSLYYYIHMFTSISIASISLVRLRFFYFGWQMLALKLSFIFDVRVAYTKRHHIRATFIHLNVLHIHNSIEMRKKKKQTNNLHRKQISWRSSNWDDTPDSCFGKKKRKRKKWRKKNEWLQIYFNVSPIGMLFIFINYFCLYFAFTLIYEPYAWLIQHGSGINGRSCSCLCLRVPALVLSWAFNRHSVSHSSRTINISFTWKCNIKFNKINRKRFVSQNERI